MPNVAAITPIKLVPVCKFTSVTMPYVVLNHLDGQTLQMGERLTVRHSHAHPVQPIDFPERFKGVINPNFDNSVRCVVTHTKKIM